MCPLYINHSGARYCNEPSSLLSIEKERIITIFRFGFIHFRNVGIYFARCVKSRSLPMHIIRIARKKG